MAGNTQMKKGVKSSKIPMIFNIDRSGWTAWVSLFFTIGLLLFSMSCKDFGIPDYSLNVVVQAGVTGTPAAGNYSYKDLSVVAYNYSPVDSGQLVEVLVNGMRYSAGGNLTIYTKSELVAKIFDIRGSWTIKFKYSAEDKNKDKNLKDFNYKIDFSGATSVSGTFTDDRGKNGTWAIVASTKILTITYTNWSNYILTGSTDSMSGEWKGDGKTGSWSSFRN